MDREQGLTITIIPHPDPGQCVIRDTYKAEVTHPNGNIILELNEPPRRYTQEEYDAGHLPPSSLENALTACAGCVLNKRNGGPCIPTSFRTLPQVGVLPGYGRGTVVFGDSLEILTNWEPH